MFLEILQPSAVIPVNGAVMQQGPQVLAVEGDQGIEVPFSDEGTGTGDEGQNPQNTADESPPVKQPDEQQQDHAAQLHGVAHLIAVLGVVGDGHEGHIYQHLRHQPPGLHRKVS